MKKFKSIIMVNRIFRFLLLIIMIFLFFLLALNFVEPKKVIDIVGFRHLVVTSGSMEPIINTGDIIFVKKCDVDTLKPGDIITFYFDVNSDIQKEIVTHFFYYTETENGQTIYRTKRANTDIPDSWKLKEENIIGKYCFRIKKAGKFILFLRQPIGMITIFLDFSILMIFAYLTDNKAKKTLSDKKQK